MPKRILVADDNATSSVKRRDLALLIPHAPGQTNAPLSPRVQRRRKSLRRNQIKPVAPAREDCIGAGADVPYHKARFHSFEFMQSLSTS